MIIGNIFRPVKGEMQNFSSPHPFGRLRPSIAKDPEIFFSGSFAV